MKQAPAVEHGIRKWIGRVREMPESVLATRDRGFYRRYFDGLVVVEP